MQEVVGSIPIGSTIFWLKKLTTQLDGWTSNIHHNLDSKYNPNQPRVPRGNSDGGQWTDGAGGGGTARTKPSTQLPRRKPASLGKPPHPHADSPYYDPVTGIYDPPINPTWSPLDFIGAPAKPIVGAIGNSGRAAYNAYRLRRYLDDARQIPKGVKEVSKGTKDLTSGQQKTLKEFKRARSKHKKDIEVINYSDGRAVFTVKQPAKNIPGSYTVWEKQVDATGKTIRHNKTTVGPRGELIHTKPYGNN